MIFVQYVNRYTALFFDNMNTSNEIAAGRRKVVNMEIQKGDIFYDRKNNLYLVVTNCIFTDQVRYICMVFNGYETHHQYFNDKIVTYEELDNEEVYNTVGGLY